MYRHVVLRLKADGVTNAIWTMDYMGYSKWCEQSWFSQLYPGDDVVDWIAYDPYSTASGTFGTMADGKDGTKWAGFYKWATTVHPTKPLMLAEWGVTETSDANAKANFFKNMPSLEKSYPAIKALVYWNSGGYPTRIDSTPQSLAAFKALVQNPMYNTPLPTS
jgi:beta-mannanase